METSKLIFSPLRPSIKLSSDHQRTPSPLSSTFRRSKTPSSLPGFSNETSKKLSKSSHFLRPDSPIASHVPTRKSTRWRKVSIESTKQRDKEVARFVKNKEKFTSKQFTSTPLEPLWETEGVMASDVSNENGKGLFENCCNCLKTKEGDETISRRHCSMPSVISGKSPRLEGRGKVGRHTS